MKSLIFAVIFMTGCGFVIPNIGTCISVGQKEIQGKTENIYACFFVNENGGYITFDNKKYDCEYTATDHSDKVFKVDINMLEITGEIYVDVDGQKIRCSIS
jgi:hypothetical protein